jgi:hypothetical protein
MIWSWHHKVRTKSGLETRDYVGLFLKRKIEQLDLLNTPSVRNYPAF